ncbi:hypothetical protein P7C73_g4392, partial [Tremellales sp. Uapishka_1]
MRLVNTGWRRAVDASPFWPTYTLTLDPSRHHSSTVQDLRSSRLTPSTPSFPTLFHRARSTTLSICLACRLNHPSRLGFYPAKRERATRTSKFGIAPTCDTHYNRYCANCLTEDSDRHGMSEAALWGDTDEYGRLRPYEAMTCESCRGVAIEAEIHRILVECARGGEVRGTSSNWVRNVAYCEYVELGVSTARVKAYEAVEEQFLVDQMRWDELMAPARNLQAHEQYVKYRYQRKSMHESPHLREQRLALEVEVKGDELDEEEEWESDHRLDKMYPVWWRESEMANPNLRSPDAGDHKLQTMSEEVSLDDYFRGKLVTGCINDFLTDRIRAGFWVSPSDEVTQLALGRNGSRIHTPFPILARHAKYPLPSPNGAPFELPPIEALKQHAGLLCLRPREREPHIVDPFLPPPKLLDKMEAAFGRKLAVKLEDPFHEVVACILQDEGDDDRAEAECGEKSASDLLGYLAMKDTWIVGGLAYADDSDESTIESDEEENVNRSPQIQLVHDDNDDEVEGYDYGISIDAVRSSQELETPLLPSDGFDQLVSVVSSPSDGQPPLSPISILSLGKRKEPPTPNPENTQGREKKPTPPSTVEGTASGTSDDGDESPRAPDGEAASQESAMNGLREPVLVLVDNELPAGKDQKADSPLSSVSSTPLREPRPLLSAKERPKVNLLVPYDQIPYVPHPTHELGPQATAMIMEIWYDSRNELRECRCRICERSKKRALWYEE